MLDCCGAEVVFVLREKRPGLVLLLKIEDPKVEILKVKKDNQEQQFLVSAKYIASRGVEFCSVNLGHGQQ